MHKKLSFIILLSLFLLNFNISSLIAAGTDHAEKQEQLVNDLENKGSSSCDLVKDENQFDLAEENQEDLTPYITFSNKTKKNAKILNHLLEGSVVSEELDHIYRIEARHSYMSTIDALYDLQQSNIKLEFSGRKKYNNPNDHEGNASFSAEYQIIIEGEIIPETFWINVSRKNPLFTNGSNVFRSSIEHLCNGTYCHEGKTYKFGFISNSGKNTIRSLCEWGKPSFELIINSDLSDAKINDTHGTLYFNNKESKRYYFDVQKK